MENFQFRDHVCQLKKFVNGIPLTHPFWCVDLIIMTMEDKKIKMKAGLMSVMQSQGQKKKKHPSRSFHHSSNLEFWR